LERQAEIKRPSKFRIAKALVSVGVGAVGLYAYLVSDVMRHLPEESGAVVLNQNCLTASGMNYDGVMERWLEGEGCTSRSGLESFLIKTQAEMIVGDYNPKRIPNSPWLVLADLDGNLRFHPELERCGIRIRKYNRKYTPEINISNEIRRLMHQDNEPQVLAKGNGSCAFAESFYDGLGVSGKCAAPYMTMAAFRKTIPRTGNY
jgi:hypothetical protein